MAVPEREQGGDNRMSAGDAWQAATGGGAASVAVRADEDGAFIELVSLERMSARGSRNGHSDLRNGHSDPSASAEDDARDPLFLASLEGDIEAFARLYERFRPMLLAICVRQLRDQALAEDVLQETFLRAFANLPRFERGRRLAPWLITMAERRCIDLHRRRSHVRFVEDIEQVGGIRLRGGQSDSTLEAVIDGDERKRLARALQDLPPRQRRALLLYAVEGWNYTEIASAEGVTLPSVKSLIFRARRTLREACGALGVILLPWRALRRVGESAGERARRAAGPSGPEMIVSATANQVAAGIVAFAMTVSGLSWHPGVERGAVAGEGGERAAEVAHAAGAGGTVERGGVPGATPLAARDASGARTLRPDAGGGNQIIDDAGGWANPGQDVRQPEDARLSAVAISPNFDRDRTMFAAGRPARKCDTGACVPVLFRSSDGGSTWERLAAAGLTGNLQILLPPRFGRGDPRMFVRGVGGLQVSEDGGATFIPATPDDPLGAGSASVASTFGSSGCRIAGGCGILVGATALTLYDDHLRASGPAPYAVGVGPTHPAYSPDYARDGLVVVGGYRKDHLTRQWGTVYRCAGAACTVYELGALLTPRIAFALDFARSGVVYAFGDGGWIWASTDRAASFSRTAIPWGDASRTGVSMRDLVPGEEGRVYAAVWPDGVYVSPDRGATWSLGRDPLFERGLGAFERGLGAESLAVSGRYVLAALSWAGLGCSVDGGRTWAPRCPSA